MVTVKPFRGLRPAPQHAAAVAAPPYDVLNTKEARALAAGNPLSFLRVNKAELEFDDSVDPYSREVYERGRDNLQRLQHDGILTRDTQPCFYLYRLTMGGKAQTGLVALTAVAEYDVGTIKRHEHTKPDKVKDRANHIEILDAQVGPVFCAFRDREDLTALFNRVTATKPEYDFVAADQIRHELWVVREQKTIDGIVAGFTALPHIYIADGHHRSAAASEVSRRRGGSRDKLHDFFLNVIFPASHLRILPYNRVIKDLGGKTLATLLEAAAAKFEVTRTGQEPTLARPHQFGLYAEKGWTLLEAKPGSFPADNPTASIDASIIGDNFIAPLLGITNPKTDKRIDFVGGIRGNQELVRLVDDGEAALAIAVYPTTLEQLFQVADAGEVMPPKSTWFEPKLRDGVVVSLLSE